MSKTTQSLKKLLLILFVFSGKSAFSQSQGTPLNTIDVNTMYSPASRYKQHDGNVQNTEKTQKRIDLGYSFRISKKVDTATHKINSWTGTVSGSYTQMDNKVSDRDIIPNHLFNSQLSVSNLRSLSGKWLMMSLFSVGINSDLVKVNFHDLYINGGVIFIKNYSPSISFGFGGYIFNALNTPIVLPAIVFHLRTEGKFKFNIDPPTEISTTYDMTSKMELKLAFRLRTMSYDTENIIDPKKRYLTYTEYPLGLESKWKSKHFDFILGGGYLLARNFTLKESGIKNVFKKQPLNRLGGNAFINAGIRYRLKTK
jgi:hypothetical protein